MAKVVVIGYLCSVLDNTKRDMCTEGEQRSFGDVREHVSRYTSLVGVRKLREGVHPCPIHRKGVFHHVLRLRTPPSIESCSANEESVPTHPSRLLVLDCCVPTCEFNAALYAHLRVQMYCVRRKTSHHCDWYLGSLDDDTAWQQLIVHREQLYRRREIRTALQKEKQLLQERQTVTRLTTEHIRNRVLLLYGLVSSTNVDPVGQPAESHQSAEQRSRMFDATG